MKSCWISKAESLLSQTSEQGRTGAGGGLSSAHYKAERHGYSLAVQSLNSHNPPGCPQVLSLS